MKQTTYVAKQAPANVCPNCMRPMKFMKSIRLGPSPHELRVFLCPHCGEVESKEVKRAS
jgi:hypothetical protein